MSRISTVTIGEIEIISLTDGGTEFGAELFPNATEDQIKALLENAGAGAIETNFNAFLVKNGDRTLLVDAGPRDLFGPTAGFLGEAMDEAGVAPEDVTDLFFTHLHPDHIAGAITAEGAAIFTNAAVTLSDADHAFWANADDFTDDTLKQWAGLAGMVIGAYGDRVSTLSGEAEIIPGVTMMMMPGHTPGHAGFRADSGGQGFIHLGDMVHAPALQLANPEISVMFDIDADTARATRKRGLDMAATDGLACSGGHMLRPTLGQLEKVGDGYRFVTG
ncbi:MAG: MBL fold metallo-hydrolase [Pikeienuella sp.]